MIPKVETYPQAHFQRCLVHVMRNICAKVRVEDRKAIMNEFKQIHQQANKAAAIDVLHAFYAKWNKSYNHVIRNLKDIEPTCWSSIIILSRSELQFTLPT